jgi:peptide/nickel transport system permease protein
MIDANVEVVSEAVAAALSRRPKKSRVSLFVSVAMLVIVLALVAIVPFSPQYDPFAQDLMSGLEPPFADPAHLLGTDALGRDILSRLCVATRVSILIAGLSVATSAILGLLLGLIAGWRGGRIEKLILAVGNIQLSIPLILLLIVLVASFGSSVPLLVLLLGLTNWVSYGRVTRAQVLALKEREFIISAVTAGGSDWWILRRHLLPNVLPAVLVLCAFDLGVIITIESSLSFIGLGVQPPTPSLGLMISEGQRYLQTDVALTLLPALVIFLLIGGVQIASQSIAPRRTRRA